MTTSNRVNHEQDQNSIVNSEFIIASLLFQFGGHRGSLAPLALIEFSDNGDYVRSEIEPKLHRRMIPSPFAHIGTCNGFVCTREYNAVGQFDAIYVNNPILGDTIQLPRCSEILNNDRSTTDFFIDECDLCTVGVDNMWRRLPDSFANLPFNADFVSLNGFFHWLPKYEGPGLIPTFDLAEERFGQIFLPPSLSLVTELVNMVAIGNQLTIVDSCATQTSIWKMKKHLDVESWTEVVILASWFPFESQRETRFLFALIELENGDMLFQCSPDSVIYINIERKRYSEIKSIDICLFMAYFIPGYTPNFSLHASLLSHADVRPRDSENVQQE